MARRTVCGQHQRQALIPVPMSFIKLFGDTGVQGRMETFNNSVRGGSKGHGPEFFYLQETTDLSEQARLKFGTSI
jgi:hypothetical protein